MKSIEHFIKVKKIIEKRKKDSMNKIFDCLATIKKESKEKKVIVVGDYFLDKYIYISDKNTGVSIYSGNAAYVIDKTIYSPGAAGTVAKNLFNIGIGKIYALGFTGDDGDGYSLRKSLQNYSIITDALITLADRNTPCYTMIMRDFGNGYVEYGEASVQNYQLTSSQTEEELITKLGEMVENINPDAIVYLDQLDYENYGVVTRGMRHNIFKLKKKYPEILVYIDSRKFINDATSLSIRKCNNHEFERAYKITSEEIPFICKKISKGSNIPIIVTLGNKGTVISINGKANIVPCFPIEGRIDTRGAGDAFTTGYITSRLCGLGELESTIIGNAVATCCVSQIATTGHITIHDIEKVLCEKTKEEIYYEL
ncbi:MAG: hypothetical protein K2O52_06660 [Oscillospiraceae bacterium]|nr:hypothetical protein [Oscillospiraceae bacterium]